MKIKSLFSKREKTVSVPQPTALVYDHIPKELRVQISYTIENLFIELRSSGRVRYVGTPPRSHDDFSSKHMFRQQASS